LKQGINNNNHNVAGINKKEEIPGAAKRGRPKGPSALLKKRKRDEMDDDEANPSDSDANGEYEDNAQAGQMNDDTDAEQV